MLPDQPSNSHYKIKQWSSGGEKRIGCLKHFKMELNVFLKKDAHKNDVFKQTNDGLINLTHSNELVLTGTYFCSLFHLSVGLGAALPELSLTIISLHLGLTELILQI